MKSILKFAIGFVIGLTADALNKHFKKMDEIKTKGQQRIAELEAELAALIGRLNVQAQKDSEMASKGYAEAYEIIADLRGRLEAQKKEFQEQLDYGYQEAYAMVEKNKQENSQTSL